MAALSYGGPSPQVTLCDSREERSDTEEPVNWRISWWRYVGWDVDYFVCQGRQLEVDLMGNWKPV